MASGQHVTSPGASRGSGQAVAALLALAAALYLTLMPFEFRQVSFTDAWALYTSQTFSMPAPGERQQWVANVLMFVPLGFFWALWLASGTNSVAVRVLVVGVVSLLALLVTATVEFVQVWIPYRGPSLVDMSGNLTGGFAGAVVGAVVGERLWRGGAAIASGQRAVSLDHLLLGYVLGYVFASLFPFDFPLTQAELLARLASDNWGLWVTPDGCTNAARCLALAVLKPLFAIPAGIWLLARMPGRGVVRLGVAVLAAIALGVALELLQLLLYSGVAEGRSALLRSLGLGAGVLVASTTSTADLRPLRERWGVVVSVLLAIPYGLAVVGLITGFTGYHWDGARALEQLQSLNFFPFYYHYFVSEAVAARSLLYQTIAYAPVGVLLWLGSGGPQLGSLVRPRGAWIAAGAAIALALVVEALKLFAEGQRPDPTSLMIAMVVATLAYRACVLLFDAPERQTPPAGSATGMDGAGASSARSETQEHTAQGGGGALLAPQEDPVSPAGGPPAWFLRAIGLSLWGVVLGAAVLWPVWAPWLVLGLVLYGVLLYFQPAACLFLVPAAVPLLDFSLLTGFEAVDEFDLLALASIASLLLLARRGRGLPRLPAAVGWFLALFTISVVVSTAVGLREMLGIAEQGVSAYLSEYNILRATKGFLFALVLFLLVPQGGVSAKTALYRYFVPGMTLGLALVVALVVWERAAYPGLFDFDSRYRISGLFTEMQVGGPSIETYLVLALPFALLWLWLRPGLVRVLIVVGLLAGGLYAVLVTYSRAGYVGVAVAALTVLSLGVAAAVRGHARRRLAVLASVLVATVLVGGLGFQYVEGFAAQRLGQSEADMEDRLNHWRHALDVRRPGPASAAFGHGPGSFPREYWLNSPADRLPANFAFQRQEEGGRLMLGAGQSMFINQRVPRVSGAVYELEVRGYAATEATLRVHLCQKHVRYSFACSSERISFPGEANDDIDTFTVALPTEGLEQPDAFPPRHVTIAMRNTTQGSVIALDAFQLRAGDGVELLRNADFSAGAQHWYFTTDELWPWRVENQWLEVFFEQGWFGLVTFVLLTLVAFLYMARGAVRDDFGNALVLAALLGVLAVGVFSTVFFSPRILFVFYLTLLLALAAGHGLTVSRGPAGHRGADPVASRHAGGQVRAPGVFRSYGGVRQASWSPGEPTPR